MNSFLKSSRKEFMMTRRKSDKGKEISIETSKTLNQLLMRSNITIKRTLLLENQNSQTVTWENVERTDLPETAKSEVNSHSKTVKNIDQKSLLISENTDYYPDRRKRNVPTKKIVLQPKHDYTVVAATNKRKRRIPKRELKSPPVKVLSSEPELSMEALIRMAEDQGMDDDDFMEILTCPSPVWWEEGSDDEEVISVRLNENPERHDIKDRYQYYTINNEEINKTNNNQAYDNNLSTCDNLKGKSLKSDFNFFKKFVKKRSKLESVLGNMKFKKMIPDIHKSSSINNEPHRKAREDSVGNISDTSINEEDLLKNLESTEIPVQKFHGSIENANKNKAKTDTKKVRKSNERCLKIDSFGLSTLRNNKKRTRKPKKSFSVPKKKDKNRSQRNVSEENCPKESDEDVDDTNIEIIPTKLPPLTKKPIRSIPAKSEFSSPKSINSTTSDTNSSAVEFDSISDTNIKFLDEYFNERNDTYESENCTKSNKSQDGEFVTVYKILSNQIDDVDVEEQIKINLVNKSPEHNNKSKKSRKINSFYKTRKRACRRNTFSVKGRV